ncbi:MAG: hypothetical protein H7256_09365 [Bdellovibrio sp.]|nr:hypothetical protein [Bdellovibrio sp.]
MKKHFFKYVFSFTTAAGLIACTTLVKRQVASTSTSFYDSDNCSLNSCAEKRYDLVSSADRDDLEKNLNRLIEKSTSLKDSRTNSLDMDELIKFNLGETSIVKASTAAIQVLNTDDAATASVKIDEIFAALKNNFRPPLDTEFQIVKLPIEFFKRVYYNKVDKTNLSDAPYQQDPAVSSVWKPVSAIKSLDVYTGFGRAEANDYSDVVCDYDKPKAGWGMNPGFHIKCGTKKFKMKIGNEVYSSPFNTRLYWALGYTVPVIDFIERPLIKYDRNILTQFNSRRNENFKLKIGDKVVKKIDHSIYHSPFDYIKEVVFKNETVMPVEEFKKHLLKDFADGAEGKDANYNVEFENQVKLIRFKPAAYLEKSEDVEIGAWRYDQLGHENRREIRGLQILAAWVGNFDMRMDNTRLVYDKQNPSVLKHALVDVGSGLGESRLLPFKTSSDVENMPWIVTKTYQDAVSDGEKVDRLQIIGLMNIEVNKAFQKMSFQDGAWMVNKLCQFTSDQLKSTLIAAGLNSAEARLAYEKLLSRRNQMIADFELTKDLAYCVKPANQKLNYTESNNGYFTATLANGVIIRARNGLNYVDKGHLR